MASRPHLRIGSIPVHVEWPFFLVAGLLGASGIQAWPGSAFVYIAVWIAIVFVSVLVHELGHAVAYRTFGQRPSITLTAFWGLTHGERTLSRGRAIVVSLSGAVAAMAVLGVPAILLRDQVYTATESIEAYQVVYYIGWVNLWWSLANLLPILPLDGGEVTRLVWGPRTARIASLVCGGAVALWLFLMGYGYAAMFMVMLAMMNLGEAMSEGIIGSGRGLGGFRLGDDRVDRDLDPPRRPKRAKPPKASRAAKRPRKATPPLTLMTTPEEPRPTPQDGARREAAIWDALRAGEPAAAAELADRANGRVLDAHLVASVAAANGRREEAVRSFTRAFGTQPTPPNLQVARSIAASGIAVPLTEALLDDPTVEVDAVAELQNHLHYTGAYADAARVGELLVADGRRSPAQSAFEVACSWAKAGDADAGVVWLSRAVESGFHAASVIETEDDLAEVRRHPGYRDVLAQLGQA